MAVVVDVESVKVLVDDDDDDDNPSVVPNTDAGVLLSL